MDRSKKAAAAAAAAPMMSSEDDDRDEIGRTVRLMADAIRVDDEEWVELACTLHAEEFLSSLSSSSKRDCQGAAKAGGGTERPPPPPPPRPSSLPSSSSSHRQRQKPPLPGRRRPLEDEKGDGTDFLSSSPSSPSPLSSPPSPGDADAVVFPDRELWKLLWEGRWDWAKDRLQTHPHEAGEEIALPSFAFRCFCPSSSSPSPGDGGLSDEDAKANADSAKAVVALPLHLACAMRPLPPTDLMWDLVCAHPRACTTHMNMMRHSSSSSSSFGLLLPIHLAADLRTTKYCGYDDNNDNDNDDPFDFAGGGDEQTRHCAPASTDEDHRLHQRQRQRQRQHPPAVVVTTGESTNHDEVIDLLLSWCPGSAAVREATYGMLPLHVAACTAKAENGIVTPVAAAVLERIVQAGPPQVKDTVRDGYGRTAVDWAWQNVRFFCSRCGMQEGGDEGGGGRQGLASSLDPTSDAGAGPSSRRNERWCRCSQVLSVSEKCVHPLLRDEIRAHLMKVMVPPPPVCSYGRGGERRDPSEQEEEEGEEEDEEQDEKEEEEEDKEEEHEDVSILTSDELVSFDVPVDVYQMASPNTSDVSHEWLDAAEPPGITRNMVHHAAKILARSNHDERTGLAAVAAAEAAEDDDSGSKGERREVSAAQRNLTDSEVRDSAPQKLSQIGKGEANEVTKNAVLYIKLRLSELAHPSARDASGGKTRFLGRPGMRVITSTNPSGKSGEAIVTQTAQLSRLRRRHQLPNPCFEMFVAHRGGMSRSYYKSYPLYNSTEGVWEEAFIDLGLTRDQLARGTAGAGHIEVGIRVMHCPLKGSKMKLIGTWQASLETLEKELQLEARHGGNMAADTPEAATASATGYPILQGYKVMGRLQVLSLEVK